MFIIGGLMSLAIRAELWQPGMQYFDPELFNQFTTMHALVMIFGGVMPGFVGLANWMVPMTIGASDLALPRVNNWGFWILPFAFTLLLSTFFLPGGAPAGGWTIYPPLVLQTGNSFPLLGVKPILKCGSRSCQGPGTPICGVQFSADNSRMGCRFLVAECAPKNSGRVPNCPSSPTRALIHTSLILRLRQSVNRLTL